MNTPQDTSHMPPLALSVVAAAKAAGIGRSTLYAAIADDLPSVRIRGRRLILRDDLHAWLKRHAVPAPAPDAPEEQRAPRS